MTTIKPEERRWFRLFALLAAATTSLSSHHAVVAAAFDPLPLGQPVSYNGKSNPGKPKLPNVFIHEPTRAKVDTPILPKEEPQQQQQQQRSSTRQTRRKSSTRRPRNYWRNIANVEYEFRKFWGQLQVKIPDNEPPPIPNESLLRHLARHNLRAAIVAHGGRELLSAQLGGARIIPGKWTEAVATSPELQQLVQQQPLQASYNNVTNSTMTEQQQQRQPSNGLLLLPDVPPWSLPQVSLATNDTHPAIASETLENLKRKRWCRKKGRNPKGYWNLQQVIQELYEYLEDYKTRHSRPSVWMPRPSEIGASGRMGLQQALSRFGGVSTIIQLAGLIPFREWSYMDGQYRLLVELRRYLDKFHNSDYSVFPCVLEMQRQGYGELHTLIQYYGGRKFLASRLSMSLAKKSSSSSSSRNYADEFAAMQWGAFDLEFAIQLLHFVRDDQMKQMPPMAKPVIAMPTQSQLLLTAHGQQLDREITKYGGYENVARRLGLAFFD